MSPVRPLRRSTNSCSPVAQLLAVVLVAAAALAGGGCSKSYDRQVYETTCGEGKLRLTLHVAEHRPAPNEVKLAVDYDAGGRLRNVDLVKPRTSLYAPPTEAERFTRLRPGDDDWPLFVSPQAFTPAEYDLIRSRLQAVLPEIDAAMATERPGERLDFGNVLRFTSTRYTDYESFRRTYRGARKDVRIELFPNGEIWCFHPQGATLVGAVVDSGRKALLPEGHGLMEKAGIANPVDYILSCRTAEGATLASQFTVERPTNKAYELALKAERAERKKR